jgi:hypothetical protein
MEYSAIIALRKIPHHNDDARRTQQPTSFYFRPLSERAYFKLRPNPVD